MPTDLALGMHPAAAAFAVVAVFVGAFVRGYSGFGSSLLWISSLSLVLPPLVVVPIVFMLEVAASVHLLPKVWPDIDWYSLRWLLLGTFAATPLGIYVLATVPATPIRVAISVVVLVATILIWRGFALRRAPGPAATTLTGLACGLLNGSTGIGGPPAILFYFSSPTAVTVSRASIIAFFLGTDSFGTAIAASQGLITTGVLVRTAMFLPFVLIGIGLGNRRFIRTNPESFRRFVLLLLVLLSISVFLRAVF